MLDVQGPHKREPKRSHLNPRLAGAGRPCTEVAFRSSGSRQEQAVDGNNQDGARSRLNGAVSAWKAEGTVSTGQGGICLSSVEACIISQLS